MDDSDFIESLEEIKNHFNQILLLYKNFTQNQYPYRSIGDQPILNKVSELIQSSQEIVDKIENQRLPNVSEDAQRKLPV
jgi:archaellum component FlaC